MLRFSQNGLGDFILIFTCYNGKTFDCFPSRVFCFSFPPHFKASQWSKWSKGVYFMQERSAFAQALMKYARTHNELTQAC